MPKFKISFYRTVGEYAHHTVEARDRETAEAVADHMLDTGDMIEWHGGPGDELGGADEEYDIEEVSDEGNELPVESLWDDIVGEGPYPKA